MAITNISTQTDYWPAKKPASGIAMSDTRRFAKPAMAPAEDAQSTDPEARLRLEALRSRALFSALSDFAFVVKKAGTIAECHVPHDDEFSLSPEVAVGKKLMDLLPPAVGQQAMYYLEKALRSGQPQTFVCSYEVLGRTREFQARLARSGPDEVIALVRDVSDRKRLEREILEISNREQMRIGQDLHDGLGQHLTGITFLTRALENDLSAKALPEAAVAAEIGQLVLQALTQTRSLARGLFPIELESNGLVPALRELAAAIENIFAIDCHFVGDEEIRIANQVTASHLFRLAQEAINNSIKHGKAKEVLIDLRKTENCFVLCVRDNGVGFAPEGLQTKGLGLRIMSYRAHRIGGSLDIQPGETGGTIVTCSCPAPTFEKNSVRRASPKKPKT